MSELLRQTLAGLLSGDNEAILTAVSFFESARGVHTSLPNPDVVFESLDEPALRQLEVALIAIAHDGGSMSGAAAWALGKRAEPRLVLPLCTALQVGLNRQNDDLVYQALIALEDSGEAVFGGESDRASWAVEYNRRVAERYLTGRITA